jgi:transcriptional regulator NrdR family protein
MEQTFAETVVVVCSGKIHVLKRDGTIEPFDPFKLCGCLLRALPHRERSVFRAGALSEAVGCYLLRRGLRCVSSAALLEMALTALRAVGLTGGAWRLEQRHALRSTMRSRTTFCHGRHQPSAFSKEWLVKYACRRWSVGRTVARILAGQIEQHLIQSGAREVSRSDIMNMLGWLAGAYGLATPFRAAAAGRPS